FTVKASDPSGAFNTEAVTLSINNVAPSTPVDSDATANRVAVGGPNGSYTGLTASSTDVNGPPVTYSIVAGSDTSDGAFAIDPATGKVTVVDTSKILAAAPSYDVTIDSSDGTLHSQQTFTIQVVVDAAPVVTAGHTLSYTEKQAATAIDPALTVADSDNATLASATVKISSNYVSGQDVLGFTNTPNITGSFNAATGTLTLTGTDTVANYQAALASVTYFNTSSNPSALDRTVTITANDGVLDSAPATDTIHVTPVDDAPVVTAGHALSYTEKQAATAIDPAITVSDVDSANLASATVQISGNYVSGQDVLGFTAQNGITGSFNSTTGTLTLSGSSSVANYQAALASVTYVNTSNNPSGLDRTVTITANDGTLSSTAVTDTIHVTPVNDPPVTSAGGTLNYLENQAATAIDPTVNVSDVDSANLTSATVAITGNYVNGQDILAFTNQNGITGSFNAATGTLTLTGSSSVANYKAALDSVTYFNSSDNPSGLDRTVSFTVNDGSLNSNTSTSTIHVTPVNDAPVVTFGTITGFTEPPNGTPASSSTPVTIAPNLTISDAEGDNLTSATFVLNNLKPSDALSISGHAGTSGDIGGIHFDISSTASTETITFTGTDTLAHYNSVLDLIQFNNTSENPDTSARSYTLTAIDDGGTANGGNNTGTASTTGTVTAVNDAPTATVPTDNSIGTAFSHTNLAISGLSIADVDGGSGNETATISSSNAALTFTTAGLASFTNNGSHTVTLTGTVAQINTALATLVYNSDDGFTGTDTVTLSVNDNGNTGSGGAQSSGNHSFHVGVVPQVFYIDNSAVSSNNLGTQADPYTSIAAFNAANPAGTGDYVVLLHGTGTYTEANGINLANGVNLIGGSHNLQFTNPVTGATVIANTASGTDPVIKVTGSDNGVDLLGTSGHTISGISIDTSASSGMGISDDGFNVGTVAISDITIKTGSGSGMSFTHGGTLTVTGFANTITSSSGTALDVESTNIGSGNLTFLSISSGSASNSGATGIILSNTGASGGLHVTGIGSTAGSGGTIQHKTGADGSTSTGNGIYLNNTVGVQLANMQLNDFQNYGISGTNVTNFTLTNTTVNGTNGTLQGGIGEGDVYFTGLSGTATITNSTFTGAAYDAFHVFNDGGQTLNRITITGSTFATQSGAGNASNDAIAFQATGGTFNATIQNSTVTSARGDMFQLNLLGTVSSDLVLGGATAGLGNNFVNTNQNIVSGGGGITIGGGGLSNNITLTYDIAHNTIKGAAGAALAVTKGTGTNASFTGTIDSNTIGTQGVFGSGSTQGEGIAVFQDGAGSSSTTITNNHVSGVVAGRGGIDLLLHNGGAGTMSAVVQNNTVDTLDQTNSFSGIYVQTGSNTVGSGSPDNNKMNLTISGNNVNLGANALGAMVAGIVLEQEGTSKVGLIGTPNYGGTPYDFTAVQNYVASHNTGTFTNGQAVFAFGDPGQPAGAGYFGGAQFLLASSGGVAAASPTSGEMHLTQSELDSVVAAAIAQWAAAGASASQLAAMHAIKFGVASLGGNVLGEESNGHITIDASAAGHGWFVDPTPSDNSEFTHALSATDLFADPTSAAAGHLDLLTAVSHELGHVVGLADDTATAHASDLMYINLVDGERRLPSAGDVANANTSGFSFQAVGSGAPPPAGPGSMQIVNTVPPTGTGNTDHSTANAVGGTFVFTHFDPSAQPPAPTNAPTILITGDSFNFSAFTQAPTPVIGDTSHAMDFGAAMQGALPDLFSGHTGTGGATPAFDAAVWTAMGGTMTDYLASQGPNHHDLVV
ncbi:beta strand repeat-containing protein, partial [Bradyrhizobium erythrophlei]|uniref:beta strand repeat-containing protein n=1 Tax=Bradyrhizobium erythrophlei TaxID=1437360 RepID=UPI0035E81942